MFEIIRTTPPPGRLQSGPRRAPTASGDKGTDLPCPWCLAETDESDPRCPSCGRRFG